MRRPRLGVRRRARHLARRLGPQRFVFVYHRVASPGHDPWGLAVSPERFAEQVEVLSRHGTLMTVSDLLAATDGDGDSRRAMAITFDDGYADNLLAARPVLDRHDAPATLFLSPRLLDGRTPFWWDELARILLETPRLPARLDLTVAGTRVGADVPADEPAPEWRAWDEPRSGRQALYLKVWALMRLAAPEEQEERLEALRRWAGVSPEPRAADRPLCEEEAAGLAAREGFEIGAHTLTHRSLPAWDQPTQAAEIAGSKRACEALCGRPVRTFSYPYGDCGAGVQRAVRHAGFDSAVTTMPGPVRRRADRTAIPRIQMLDWSGEELERRLAIGALY